MPNSYDLHGKSVIVTGGAKSIGRASVNCWCPAERQSGSGTRNTAEVTGASSDVVDITDPPPSRLCYRAYRTPETPDILVNNAGYLGTTQGFVEHPSEDWQRIVR